MADSKLKNKAVGFGESFIIRFYVQTHKDEFVDRFRKFLEPYSPADFAQMIDKGQPFAPPEELISILKDYKEQVLCLRPDEVLAWLFDWISTARPDIGDVLLAKGQVASLWLAIEAKAVYDTAFGEPKPITNQEAAKPQLSRATCDKCQKTWIVPKDDADKITRCPFCGEIQNVVKVVKEEKDEPPKP